MRRLTPRARGSGDGAPGCGAAQTIRWQICGCAALCAFGGAAGLARALGELGFHCGSPRAAVGWAGAFVAAGAVFGLWLPRRVLRRQLSELATPAAGSARGGPRRLALLDGASPGAGLEFAASLTGVLILALGVLWVLAGALTSGMEGYRVVLTQRFLHPVWLTRLLLCGPLLLSLFLLGSAAALTVAALHGWHQLVAAPQRKLADLWTTLLVAGAGGVAVAAAARQPGFVQVMPPLATFAAGVLAVLRKPVGQAPVEVGGVSASRVAMPLGALVIAVAAAMSTGAALVVAAPQSLVAAQQTAIAVAALGATTLAGFIAGRVALRFVPLAADLAPLLLLATGVAWDVPQRVAACAGLGSGLCRLMLIGGLSAACVALVTARAARALGRPQRVLAWVGAAVAAGAGVGLALAAGWLDRRDVASASAVMALVTTAVAGLALVFQRAAPRGLRRWGLAAVGVWLGAMLLLPPAPARTAAPADEHGATPAAVRAGRTLLEAPGLRAAYTFSDDRRPSVWEIDLGGPRLDAVVVASHSTPPATERLAAPLARRLLRRCTRALLDGGRLVIELPADDLITPAFRLNPGGGHLLRVTGDTGRYEALVFGPDAAAWLGERPDPPGFTVECVPVGNRAELERCLTGAAP